MVVTLPYNEEAEKAVLGTLLLDHENIYQIVEILDKDDFYLTAHKIIYETILDVFERGRAFDILTIKDQLQQNGKLDLTGGDVYLAGLVDDIPALQNVADYARIVVDKSNLRRLMLMASEILDKGSDDALSSEELFQQVEKEIFDIVTREHKSALIPVQSG